MTWRTIEEQDQRISKVIGEMESESDICEAWVAQIRQVISFPFTAKVCEVQEYGSIVQQGDLLKVHTIDDSDDKYGVIASTKLGRRKVHIPLCELEMVDGKDEGIQVLYDYAVWFSNR